MQRHISGLLLDIILLLAFSQFLFFQPSIIPDVKAQETKSETVGSSTLNWQAYFDEIVVWSLEWRNGTKWQSSSDLVIGKRSIENGTKYILNFTASNSGAYRLNITIQCDSGVSGTQRYNLTRDNNTFCFDWSDVGTLPYAVRLSDSIFSWSVMFSFTEGRSISVDPSTVGTSGYAWPVSYPFQRKTFYANTRFWVFYSDGTNMVYKTSVDGSSWTSATTVRACTNGYMFSIWFDGTYFHYAYSAFGTQIAYRKGLPNSDGTTTWSDTEQIINTLFNKAWYPSISTDSDGYVWISYADINGTKAYPYVIKSQYNNGTWGSTPSGFPYILSTTSAISLGVPTWRSSIIPLTTLRMVAIYAYLGSTVKAKSWNGTAWRTEVTTVKTITTSTFHTALNQTDDVHLAFIYADGTNRYWTIYTKYSYSSNTFGSETTIEEVAPSDLSAPVLSIDNLSNLYIFHLGLVLRHICYHKWNGTAWEPEVDWITETTDFTAYDRITCFYRQYSDYIGVIYSKGGYPPYTVRFAFLTLGVTKAWNYVSGWPFNLTARAWSQIGFWPFTLLTEAWNVVSSWIFSLTARSWQNINFWIFSLRSPGWNSVSSWTFQLLTLGWHSIAFWIFSLTPFSTGFLLIPLLFLVGVVLFLMAVALGKKFQNEF